MSIWDIFKKKNERNKEEKEEEVIANPTSFCGWESLGDGYYLSYEEKGNGFGGYHRVSQSLYKKDKLVRKITDDCGRFLDFPGVRHGLWERNLKFSFQEKISFASYFCHFGKDGLAKFIWTVQPDGRYWADEDGFGMERDVEIELYSKLNKEGYFIMPFKVVKK